MDPRDPACPCDRCGHRRDMHYFDDLSEGAAFACCECTRFVPPGMLRQYQEEERSQFLENVGLLFDKLGEYIKRKAASRSSSSRPRT